MEVSREELAERFRERSDEELLTSLQSGTLTPLATDVAALELRSRGVEPYPKGEVAEESGDPGPGDLDGPTHDHNMDLVTVAEFWNPLEANLLRACLESHGLFVHVWGEHLGIAHIILSVATGGTRLQVPSDQVDQAKEIIAAFKRGDFAIDKAPE